MGVPPGNRPAAPRDWFRGVPEWYVAGADTRGRPGGRPYPGSQQAIHETSGLTIGEGDKIIGIEILDASKHVNLDRLLPVNYKLSRDAI
jgi:hypothetical protein